MKEVPAINVADITDKVDTIEPRLGGILRRERS